MLTRPGDTAHRGNASASRLPRPQACGPAGRGVASGLAGLRCRSAGYGGRSSGIREGGGSLERLAQVPQGHGRKESAEAVGSSQVADRTGQFGPGGGGDGAEGCCGVLQEVGQLGDPGSSGTCPPQSVTARLSSMMRRPRAAASRAERSPMITAASSRMCRARRACSGEDSDRRDAGRQWARSTPALGAAGREQRIGTVRGILGRRGRSRSA